MEKLLTQPELKKLLRQPDLPRMKQQLLRLPNLPQQLRLQRKQLPLKKLMKNILRVLTNPLTHLLTKNPGLPLMYENPILLLIYKNPGLLLMYENPTCPRRPHLLTQHTCP